MNCKPGDLAYVYRTPKGLEGLIGRFFQVETGFYNPDRPDIWIWNVEPFFFKKVLFEGVADDLLRPVQGLDPNSADEKQFLDELKKAGEKSPATTTPEKETTT